MAKTPQKWYFGQLLLFFPVISVVMTTSLALAKSSCTSEAHSDLGHSPTNSRTMSLVMRKRSKLPVKKKVLRIFYVHINACCNKYDVLYKDAWMSTYSIYSIKFYLWLCMYHSTISSRKKKTSSTMIYYACGVRSFCFRTLIRYHSTQ